MKNNFIKGGTPSFLTFITYRKMKLIVFFAVISFFQLIAATAYAQQTNLTLKLTGVTLEQAIQAIEEQTPYVFSLIIRK
ncbi:MAG: hypothetical protein LUD02_04990 [Tannerellaceae bacterium]|nr:hypothetical protein [Tannerellaceae bacterium]MCD8263583.1 hypothetical protein [Tannerellaceae bacterium]